MNKEIDLLLGEEIKKARLEKGYTLEYVAKKIGVKQLSTIGHYENGRRSMSIDILIKMCKALDVDYKVLLDKVAEKI